MVIESRDSEDYLHTNVVLKKISEYDIFKHYCGPFKDIGTRFCSDFREDSSNDSVIVKMGHGLLFKDFGKPEHTLLKRKDVPGICMTRCFGLNLILLKKY